MNRNTYVMSDIHGCYDEFMQMLKLINFSSDDVLYILGDIWDRGPEPLKVLDYILGHKNIIHLKGNHEWLYEEAYESNNFSMWFGNGGKITYIDMLEKGPQFMDNVYEYVKNLPTIKVLDKYILVHAGLYFPKNANNLELDEFLNEYQSEETLLWSRDNLDNEKQYRDYTVVCGHTPVQSIVRNTTSEAKILRRPGTIYIDCGCVFKNKVSAKLACLRLNDNKEYYI